MKIRGPNSVTFEEKSFWNIVTAPLIAAAIDQKYILTSHVRPLFEGGPYSKIFLKEILYYEETMQKCQKKQINAEFDSLDSFRGL